MAYVALKPCRFAGQAFRIGDAVPDEVIHPGAAKNLLKMQVIAIESGTMEAPVAVKAEPVSLINIVATDPTGDSINLEITCEGMQAVFDVLTGKTANAEPIIQGMTDGDALILLHLADSRKAVKEAAEARAKAMEGEQ